MKILIATTNKGKVREFKEIIKNVDFLTLDDFKEIPKAPIETGETFEENARIKAKHYFDFFQMPVICEDSGLCVDELKGIPGVHSANWGIDGDFTTGINKIYELLDGLPSKAHFVSFIILKTATKEILTRGIVEGEISPKPKGRNGFGFDPCFIPNGYSQTFAEMDIEKKSLISHRRIAINNLLKML